MFSGRTLLRRRKYTVLLAVLLAMVVLQSFSVATGSEEIWRDVMATFFGVAIILVVFERSALQTVVAVFLFIALAIGWALHAHVSSVFDRALAITQAVALAIFYWVVVWEILRNLFRTPVIGADNVFGAICGYLIAGQAWAYQAPTISGAPVPAPRQGWERPTEDDDRLHANRGSRRPRYAPRSDQQRAPGRADARWPRARQGRAASLYWCGPS